MIGIRILAVSIAWVVTSAPVLSAQDLSKYREFQLGTSLVTVARQAGITPEARVIHQRPELIQELMWQPPHIAASPPQGDSVSKVLFGFYHGQLFRMVVTYDRDRTEGLTVEDMVNAVSTTYGLAAALPATAIVPSVVRVSYDSDKILAQWEDAQYSLSLFRSRYLSTYGLVVLSKRLDALVRVATVEALLLDQQEAPQREIERQQRQTEETRVKEESARRVNKPTFRP